MEVIKTQVGIIGAGPAGLVLSKYLHKHGIDNVLLESRSRDYVEKRLRAGLLEQNTVDMLKYLGVADNLLARGLEHHGVQFCFNGKRVHIPFDELTGGRHITIYGQRMVVSDLIANLVDTCRKPVIFNSKAHLISGLEEDRPIIHFKSGKEEKELHCDYVAACDGYHGVGRKTLPTHTFNTHRIEYPFCWLGILAETPPSSDELIYAYHDNGFALLSYRSPTISRLYLQVDKKDHLENWPDDRIWEELKTRLGTEGFVLNTGKIIDKSITPMRSYMIDHMQYRNLFLAGDAAHIVPPTGGKGLNLAVADVKWLGEGLIAKYESGNDSLLGQYSKNALRRVWRAQHFSNFMTKQFHKIHKEGSYDYHLQKAQFDYIANSRAMRATIAENYVGLKEI